MSFWPQAEMDEFAFWGQIAGLYYKIGSATTPVNHSSSKDKKKKKEKDLAGKNQIFSLYI